MSSICFYAASYSSSYEIGRQTYCSQRQWELGI